MKTTTIAVLDTAAPVDGLIESHLVRPGDPAEHPDAETALRAAIARARRWDGHVHRMEDEHGPAWRYVVCNDAACEEEG